MAHNPPQEQHPIPDDIRVFWINDYECWAGRSIEECVDASMKLCGVSHEEAYDEADAYEIPRGEWDSVKQPNDPDERVFRDGAFGIDWHLTSWETLRETVASCASFPAYLGGRE